MNNLNFWRKYAWIKRGNQRREVIKILPDRPFTAEDFRKEINTKTALKLSLREMSRHLTSFAKQGIIECITPEAPYGRLYIAKKVSKELKKEILKEH